MQTQQHAHVVGQGTPLLNENYILPLSEAEAQAQFLQSLARIVDALEKQNELLKENTYALGAISNRIEDVMGCMFNRRNQRAKK